MFRFFETRIDPFRAHDESMPPANLFGFYARYCRQVWPFLVALMAIGLVVSLIEVSILRFVGVARRYLAVDQPGRIAADARRASSWRWRCWFSSVVRSRTSLMISSTQQAIAPGMTNLIRWQTHRYVLRQSLSYFANDFAGRIASNIMQAGASLRDSVVQVIDALWFVAVFAISALVIFAQTDWRLAFPLALWIANYVATLVYFIPRIRRRSQELAHMRATLTGRIVDSYTNIQTVKLFAHLEREDQHAREALVDHTAAFHRQTRLITLMNLTVSTSNSLLLVSASGASPSGSGREAASRSATSRSRRASRIASSRCRAWVMWTSIGIFDNVGTSAGRHADDRAAARSGRHARTRARWSRRAARSGSRTCASTTARAAA